MEGKERKFVSITADGLLAHFSRSFPDKWFVCFRNVDRQVESLLEARLFDPDVLEGSRQFLIVHVKHEGEARILYDEARESGCMVSVINHGRIAATNYDFTEDDVSDYVSECMEEYRAELSEDAA